MNLVAVLIRRLQEMAAELVRTLPQLAIGLLILFVTWAAARFGRRLSARLLRHTDLRPSLINLVDTLVTVLVWVLGILISMSVVLPSVTPANLLAALGLGSVAIGFAFKDIFENFLAGVLIMLRKNMRVGDMIECDSVAGRVEHISLRDTHLRHLSNELVIVPNSYLYKNPVKVLTDNAQRRHQIVVGVAYDVDLDAAQTLIRDAVAAVELVDASKRIDVFAEVFNESSIDFTVRWWAGSKPYDMHASKDAVVRAIKRALDDAGIEIPYPYQTLTFKEPLPIRSARSKPAPRKDPPAAAPASEDGGDRDF